MRRFYEEHPPRAEYALTDKGRELGPLLKALLDWGERRSGRPPSCERARFQVSGRPWNPTRARAGAVMQVVMPALVAGIHAFCATKAWMAGTSPAMTIRSIVI